MPLRQRVKVDRGIWHGPDGSCHFERHRCSDVKLVHGTRQTPFPELAAHEADRSGRLERCAVGAGLTFRWPPGHFSGIRLESIAASCAWRFAPVFRKTDFS
jgi:hypothetical protein